MGSDAGDDMRSRRGEDTRRQSGRESAGRRRNRVELMDGRGSAKPWLYEPVFAAILGLALSALWVAGYSLQLRAAGVETSGASAPPDDQWHQSILHAAGVLLVVLWAALAVLLNRVTRARTVGRRLLVSFGVAVIVCLPLSVEAGVQLATNDGWSGIGVVALLFQVSGPLFAVAFHLLALPFVSMVSRRRRAGVPT